MRHQKQILFVVMAMLWIIQGCSELDENTSNAVRVKERWNDANDPTGFRNISLQYNIDSLPMSGRAEKDIWPSTYWATKEDSINVRWADGELSPAEKYDRAFNGWEPEEGFMALRPYKEALRQELRSRVL